MSAPTMCPTSMSAFSGSFQRFSVLNRRLSSMVGDWGCYVKEGHDLVAGHLQEKKGYFYIVLNYKDECGKRKNKWISTGLSVKGNKKKAEALLIEARKNFEVPQQVDQENPLFSDFMLQWLEMMKHRIENTTYASYSNAIKGRIAPYFKEKGIRLKELQPKHIQDYYQYELEVRGVTANTVIHYHANIRKALQYAFKTDMIPSNPADKVERPKKINLSAVFMTKKR